MTGVQTCALPISSDDGSPSGPVPAPNTGTPSKDGGTGPTLGVVAPPFTYDNVPLKMPHIANHGSPPKLDTTNFALWQFLMESHLKSCSMEVWNIIERGFAPTYANDLTRREEVDCQFNATALNIIQNALSQKELAHIRSCKTAKGA